MILIDATRESEEMQKENALSHQQRSRCSVPNQRVDDEVITAQNTLQRQIL